LLNDLQEFRQSRTEAVPTIRHWGAQTEAVITDGFCPWHDDSHLDQSWSCLLIVRNDTNSWVEVEGCPVNINQPVGTLVLFNLNEMHRLNCGGGRRSKPGVWCALAWDSKEDLHVEAWHERILRSFESTDRLFEESNRKVKKAKI
jgi:hypothetical protein